MSWNCKPKIPVSTGKPAHYAIEFWRNQVKAMQAEADRLRHDIPNTNKRFAELEQTLAKVRAESDQSLAAYKGQTSSTPAQSKADRLRNQSERLEREASELEWDDFNSRRHRENSTKAEGYQKCIERAERELSQLTK